MENLSHKPLHIIYHVAVHMSSILHPFVKKYSKFIFKIHIRIHIKLIHKKSLHSAISVHVAMPLRLHFEEIMHTFGGKGWAKRGKKICELIR